MENENWKMARMFIENFQMRNGYTNYSEIARQLNLQGYKTRNGCMFSAGVVKRLC